MNTLIINQTQFIRKAEEKGWATRTFRRLDPDRQNAIILAILEEAAESGPADINIKQVAERCGVAVGSMYQYFGSREQLINFAIELVVGDTVASFEQYTDMLAAMPLREALEAYLGGGMEWSREQIGMARMFARAAYQGVPGLSERVVRPIADVMTNMVRAMLLAAHQRGEIRDDFDLEAITRLINVQMIAIGDAQLFPHLNDYYQFYDADLSLERILKSYLQLLEDGLMKKVQP
ncbi:MAG: TetR/AcrR family transcriptional regulator [Anaerolineaceae bacterium]